jgi:hypothetical protein
MIEIDHKKWLKKFNKTKKGKIFNLLYEIKIFESSYANYDKISHLCLALLISTKGTNMEEDSIELVKIICPEYFSDKE